MENHGNSRCSVNKSTISMAIFYNYFDITREYIYRSIAGLKWVKPKQLKQTGQGSRVVEAIEIRMGKENLQFIRSFKPSLHHGSFLPGALERQTTPFNHLCCKEVAGLNPQLQTSNETWLCYVVLGRWAYNPLK